MKNIYIRRSTSKPTWQNECGTYKINKIEISQIKMLSVSKITVTYGAIMALAGPNVDCACDNQPSSCAFSWDPKANKEKSDYYSLNNNDLTSTISVRF